ncbi:MAG: phosphatidylserine decarboxylase, partial [Burkholderiales bacterium]
MSDRLAVLPQYIFPKNALTAFAGKVANAKLGWLTTWIITRFVAHYSVNM